MSLDSIFVHPRGLCKSDSVGHRTHIRALPHFLAGARVGCDCNGAFVENAASLGDRFTVKSQGMVFEGVHVADDDFLRSASAASIPEAPSPAAVR
jgi:UDP-2-acetamido-3-amino-2,3-dideoxy-glucuronate N-acetyltransferase